jgi:uncharacterized protein
VTGRGGLVAAAERRQRRALLAAPVLAAVAIAGFAAFGTGHRGATAERSITISLQGDVTTILDPPNLRALVALERRIRALPGVRDVVGPGTFVEQSVEAANRTIRQQVAATHPYSRAAAHRRLIDLLVRYGYERLPSLDNVSFVGQLIFGSGTQPMPRFTWLFPDADHAVVLIRPQAGLSSERTQALGNQIARLVDAAPLQGVSTRYPGSRA